LYSTADGDDAQQKEKIKDDLAEKFESLDKTLDVIVKGMHNTSLLGVFADTLVCANLELNYLREMARARDETPDTITTVHLMRRKSTKLPGFRDDVHKPLPESARCEILPEIAKETYLQPGLNNPGWKFTEIVAYRYAKACVPQPFLKIRVRGVSFSSCAAWQYRSLPRLMG
jgi:hypothetical protein